MKKLPFLFMIFCLLFTGCMKSKEHLTINKDGSGTLEVSVMVPSATSKFLDKMFGGVIKGMAQAMGKGEEVPESFTEAMFGKKEEIIKKAEEGGVNIEFISFVSEKKEDGLYVRYEIKFDDIEKLLNSDLMSTKIKIGKDSSGRLVCATKSDPQKAEESQVKLQQFKQMLNSDEADPQALAMRDNLVKAMEGFQADFFVTMPNKIEEITGVFVKKDENTASISLSGDILNDFSLIEKLYGGGLGSTSVVCGWEGITFDLDVIEAQEMIPEGPEEIEEADDSLMPPIGSKVKVFFKDGKIVEGKLVEENDESIKIDSIGIPLSYYRSDIERIENLDF